MNGRGPGLKATQPALREAGHCTEANAIGEIPNEQSWSAYVTRLLDNVQQTHRA